MKNRTTIVLIIICVLALLSVGYSTSTNHVHTSQKDTYKSDNSSKKKDVKSSTIEGIKIKDRSSKATDDSKKKIGIISLTESQKEEVNTNFLKWAIDRANIGNMAVTDLYFNHGSGGQGDYFASTPDGDIQVQDMNNPGASGFNIHAIGGVTFYKTLSGSTGYQDLSSNSIADGYGNDYDTNEPAVKYLLADNGVVYESIHHTGVNGPGAGYYEMDDTGKLDGTKEYTFYESKDSAAQSELKSILQKYTTN